MRWLALTLVAVAASGCGAAATPRLQHADANRLIALTHRIAGEGKCAQAQDIPKLQAQTIALVNAHRVPRALEEPLLSGVQALGAEVPVCLPSVPAAPVAPVVTHPAPHPHPGPPHPPPPPHHHGHGPGHDR